MKKIKIVRIDYSWVKDRILMKKLTKLGKDRKIDLSYIFRIFIEHFITCFYSSLTRAWIWSENCNNYGLLFVLWYLFIISVKKLKLKNFSEYNWWGSNPWSLFFWYYIVLYLFSALFSILTLWAVWQNMLWAENFCKNK